MMTQSPHLTMRHSLFTGFTTSMRERLGWILSVAGHLCLLLFALSLFSSPQPYSAHEGAISVDVVTHMSGSPNQKNRPSLEPPNPVQNTPPPAPPPPAPAPAPKMAPLPVPTLPPPPVRESVEETLPEPAKKPKPVEKKTIADVLNEMKSTEDTATKKPLPKTEVPPKNHPPVEVEKKQEKQERVFDPKAIENPLTQKKDGVAQTPPKADRHSETPALSRGVPGGSSARLSLAQRDALGSLFKEQLAQCWSIPVGLNTGDYKPEIVIHLDENGGLVGEPRVVNVGSDSASRALADSALRAIRRCAPFRIPASFNPFYSEWRDWHITFDPKDFIS
jgi:hypothetical protein